MMFRMIGGAVVYGFALYGVAAFLGRPKVKVFLAQGRQGRGTRGETHETRQDASSEESATSSATGD